MRSVILGVTILLATFMTQPAHADPYQWCAEYGGFRGGGATNCYFLTLQQCQAAISGVGGFCRRNTFYTGPEGGGRSPKRKKQRSTE
jgi:hypothetical protein